MNVIRRWLSRRRDRKEQAFATASGVERTRRRHPFGDVCVHGVGFLDECDYCPDGWQPPSDAKAGGAW